MRTLESKALGAIGQSPSLSGHAWPTPGLKATEANKASLDSGHTVPNSFPNKGCLEEAPDSTMALFCG